jgi:predicted membrane protein
VWNLWPLVLVFIGVRVLLNKPGSFSKSQDISNNNFVSDNVVMGEMKRRFTSKEFQGGKISAFMGTVELDLRDVKIADKATLDVSAFMGTIDITAPTDVRITNNVTAFIGSFEDHTRDNNANGTPELIITGSAFMGTVSVR